MQRLSPIELFRKSFYDWHTYYKIAKIENFQKFKYLLIICFCLSFFYSSYLLILNRQFEANENSNSQISQILYEIVENFQDLEIHEGLAKSNNNEKYAISLKQNGQATFLEVDTSIKQADRLRNSGALIQIFSDAIIYNFLEEPFEVKFERIFKQNQIFTKEDLVELIEKYRKLNMYLIPLVFFPVYAILKAGKTYVFSWLFASIITFIVNSKNEYDFEEVRQKFLNTLILAFGVILLVDLAVEFMGTMFRLDFSMLVTIASVAYNLLAVKVGRDVVVGRNDY